MDCNPNKIKMEVKGAPAPLPRPRLGRGGFYNPKSRHMVHFKAQIRAALPHTPMFHSDKPLSVDIKFFMKRPNSDFRGEGRMAEMLKTTAAFAKPIHPDIDNLAKLVLDALNGLFYADDRQVVKLLLHKFADSEGGCNGRTVVECSAFQGRIAGL